MLTFYLGDLTPNTRRDEEKLKIRNLNKIFSGKLVKPLDT